MGIKGTALTEAIGKLDLAQTFSQSADGSMAQAMGAQHVYGATQQVDPSMKPGPTPDMSM